MWRNYVFLIIFRAVSFVRFDSAVHKEWLKIAFRTHITVSSPCSHNVYKSFRKRDEVAFTPCSTHFSASSLRFSKMSYQSVSDFIFRFTLAIRRCTTTRSFGCFCQLALAQYRPFRSFIRENYAFRVYLSRVTASFYPLFYYILIRNFLHWTLCTHRFCAFGNKKIKIY